MKMQKSGSRKKQAHIKPCFAVSATFKIETRLDTPESMINQPGNTVAALQRSKPKLFRIGVTAGKISPHIP